MIEQVDEYPGRGDGAAEKSDCKNDYADGEKDASDVAPWSVGTFVRVKDPSPLCNAACARLTFWWEKVNRREGCAFFHVDSSRWVVFIIIVPLVPTVLMCDSDNLLFHQELSHQFVEQSDIQGVFRLWAIFIFWLIRCTLHCNILSSWKGFV